MAETLIKFLHKTRYLIVGALVTALISGPFGSDAKESSQVRLNAANIIAGMSNEIEITNAKPKSSLEILVSKPDNTQVVLDTTADSNGEAVVPVSDYHLEQAGLYTVEARNSTRGEDFSKGISFKVKAGTVSEEKSTVAISDKTVKTGETLVVKVKLQDSFGNPISNHITKLLSNKKGVEIYTNDPYTNEKGIMEFYVSGKKAGIAELKVVDSSANKTLSIRPKIAFEGKTQMADTGGYSIKNTDIIFAEESGVLSAFEIDGLDDQVKVGESQSITVTAVDSDGFIITDYEGEIEFSSSDDEATLPNDYTFEADDQGEHTFSLSIKFVTPGDQTITVTDTEQTDISGELSTEVVTSFSDTEGEVDYEEDFETEDFERDGDFTLISPASGSFSSSEIDVQGEGDYGYSAIIYLDDEEAARTEIDVDNTFAYTLEDIEDGDHEIYVDIVDITGEDEDEEITVIESSDVEEIIVDTTAPELVSVSVKPDSTSFAAGETVSVTVLSEEDLAQATLIFNDESTSLEEQSTSGKYQADLVMPDEIGDYTLDINLEDELGNEAQFRDEYTFTVGEAAAEEEEETTSMDTVSGLTISVGKGEVTLSWEAAGDDVSFYRVYYGPSSDALYASEDTYDSSTSWTVTDLEGDQDYYFAVTAVDADDNETEKSDTVLGIPLAKADTVPSTEEDDPEITDSGTPDESPETGPATNLMIILSLAGAFGLTQIRKLAYAKNF